MHYLLMIGYGVSGSGSAIYNLELARSLVKSGHKVTIYCHETRFEELADMCNKHTLIVNDTYFEGFLEENLKIISHLPSNIPAAYDRFELDRTKLLTSFNEADVHTYIKECFSMIERIHMRESISHIFVNHLGLLNSISYKMKLRFNISFSTIVHGTVLEYVLKNSTFIRRVVDYALDGCSKVIVLNESVQERFVSIYPHYSSKTLKLSPGVDVERFTSRLSKDSSNHFCYVGRQTFDKGIHCLLLAFYKIALKDQNIKLILSGDGPDIEELKRSWSILCDEGLENYKIYVSSIIKEKRSLELAESLLEPISSFNFSYTKKINIKNRVQWVGSLSRDKIADLYSSSKFSVLTSLVPEAHPLVLAESLSAGCPILGINFSGIESFFDLISCDLSNDLISRLRINSDCNSLIDSLAESISQLIEKPILQDELKVISKNVAMKYSWKVIVEKLMAHTFKNNSGSQEVCI